VKKIPNQETIPKTQKSYNIYQLKDFSLSILQCLTKVEDLERLVACFATFLGWMEVSGKYGSG